MLENGLACAMQGQVTAEEESIIEIQLCVAPLIIHKRPCDRISLLHLFYLILYFSHSKCCVA